MNDLELLPVDNFPENESALLPYQIRWFNDESEVKIAEKSRRTGLTWAEAASNVVTASKPKSRGGSSVFYIGSKKEMALEYIAAVGLFAKAFNQLAMAVETGIFHDEDGNKDILSYTVRFPNSGFKIAALSSRPSNLRGMQGDVVIDEAGFQDSLHEILKAAIALTMWGNRVRLISTHNGVDNEFNQTIQDARAGRNDYSVHRITLDDALADGLFKRICFVNNKPWSVEAEADWKANLIKRSPSKEAADEEYFCIPSQSEGAAISRAVIEACMSGDYPVIRLAKTDAFNDLSEDAKNAEVLDFCNEQLLPLLDVLDKERLHVFGEDFGRLGDLTVIDPMMINKDMSRVVPFSVELRNMPFNQQKFILFFIVDRLPRLMGGALDAGGNGMYLAEQARLRYGSSRIAEVKLSEGWYLENMPKFKASFDDHTLTIPKDADQLDDLRALQVVNGIIRLPKGKTDTAKSRHGDSAISKALAYFASYQNSYEIAYTPAPTWRDAEHDADDYAGKKSW